MATAHAGCFAFLPRAYSSSGYVRFYASDSEDERGGSATAPTQAAAVVVGKERKMFMVDRLTLQQEPLRLLLAVAGTSAPGADGGKRKSSSNRDSASDEPIFVDVDEILFEHVLWLARNGDVCPSILGMHLRDIIEFYAHEDS